MGVDAFLAGLDSVPIWFVVKAPLQTAIAAVAGAVMPSWATESGCSVVCQSLAAALRKPCDEQFGSPAALHHSRILLSRPCTVNESVAILPGGPLQAAIVFVLTAEAASVRYPRRR